MEGKGVIMSVLLLSLVVFGQIQVEAQTVCCPNARDRTCYNACHVAYQSESYCASTCGCKLLITCPPGWTNDMLENTSVNDYCKSGCVSSVCGAITTLQNSDASKVVKGAVEKCSHACSDYCTKGSVITSVVETIA